MPKKWASGALALLLAASLGTGASAAEKQDYTPLDMVETFTDNGNQTVTIEGPGLFGLEDPDEAMAIIFKEQVSPSNFKATIKMNTPYGTGIQDGWYGVNFSNKPTFLTTTSDAIVDAGISGVTVLFKLDSGNKKRLYIDFNVYQPTLDYPDDPNPARNSQLNYKVLHTDCPDVKAGKAGTPITIQKDWEFDIEIRDGELYIDGTKYTHISTAKHIRNIFPGDKAYVGFGAFAEDYRNLSMTVTYAQKPSAPAAATTTVKPQPGQTTTKGGETPGTTARPNPGSQTPAPSPDPSSEPSAATDGSRVESGSETTAGTGEPSGGSTSPDGSQPAEPTGGMEESSPSTGTQAPVNGDPQEPESSNVPLIIGVTVAALAVLGGGGAALYFLVIKKKLQAK